MITREDIWKEDLFCQCGRIGRVEIANKVADELSIIMTVHNGNEDMIISLIKTLRGSSQEGKK